MSDKHRVRKLDFQFDDSLAFQMNPGNPACGNVINFLSVLGPCFERYFIKAFREAIPLINNKKLRDEAEWFCRQEAQHSKHHLSHINALERRYPGIKSVQEAVMDSYMNKLETESLEYHLAYTAIVELAFGPTAKMIIDQRQPLLSTCQSTVASLVLWHFVEEFEHRNCAIDVYNEIVGSYWYRVKTIPSVIEHFISLGDIIRNGFNQYIPEADNSYGHGNFHGLTRGMPRTSLIKYFYHLLMSQMPLHNPDNLKSPAWAEQWFIDERKGIDMTNYYPEV